MNKNLKANWLVLANYKVFLVGASFWLIGMIVFPSMVYYLSENDATGRFSMFKDAFSFPMVNNTISVLELLPIHLLSVIIIVLVCQEFEFKTYRLYLLNGVSRHQLWLNNLYLSLIFSISTVVIAFLLSILYGFILNQSEYSFFEEPRSLRWFFILLFQSFGYYIFAMMLSVVIRKIGMVILFYMLWFGLIERVLGHLLATSIFSNSSADLFLPGKSLEELSHFVVLEKFNMFLIHISFPLQVLVAFCWVAFALIITRMVYLKIDL